MSESCTFHIICVLEFEVQVVEVEGITAQEDDIDTGRKNGGLHS